VQRLQRICTAKGSERKFRINNVADVAALDTVMRVLRSEFRVVISEIYRTVMTRRLHQAYKLPVPPAAA